MASLATGIRISTSAFVAVYVSILIAAGFLLASAKFLHWSVPVLVLCGCLIGKDAVDWIRGRLDLFDPAGILGIFGYYFFFLTPMLQIYLD